MFGTVLLRIAVTGVLLFHTASCSNAIVRQVYIDGGASGLTDQKITNYLIWEGTALSFVHCALKCAESTQDCSVYTFNEQVGVCRLHTRPPIGTNVTVVPSPGTRMGVNPAKQAEACPEDVSQVAGATSVQWSPRNNLWYLEGKMTCDTNFMTSKWDEMARCNNGDWTKGAICRQITYYNPTVQQTYAIPRSPLRAGWKMSAFGLIQNYVGAPNKMSIFFMEDTPNAWGYLDIRWPVPWGNTTVFNTRIPNPPSYVGTETVTGIVPYPFFLGESITLNFEILNSNQIKMEAYGRNSNYTQTFNYQRNLYDVTGFWAEKNFQYQWINLWY